MHTALPAPQETAEQAGGGRKMPDQPDPLRIQLLGAFHVAVGARDIHDSDWYLRKAKTLIKLLALAPGHRLHRGQITDVLWTDFDEGAAANNLHKALHIARRVLEPDLPSKTPSSYLHMDGDLVSLRSSGILSVDVEVFEAAVEQATTSGKPEDYRAAMDLYAELLPEDRYEEWAVRRRDGLKEVYASLGLDVARIYEQNRSVDDAISVLQEVTRLDPAHEHAHVSLMRLFTEAGYRQQALRQFHHLRDALRAELDAEPDGSTQRLYNQLLNDERGHAGLVEAGSAPSVSPTRGHHLGHALGGRDREISAFRQAMALSGRGEGTTLVITGEAGSGKSRLAAEFEHEATTSGAITLWGAAYTDRKRLHFWPVRVALEGFALRVAPELLQTLLGDAGPILGSVAPTIGMTVQSAGGALASNVTPEELADALSHFFDEVIEHAPLVVVLEDLHAADEDTLHLIGALAPKIAQRPVVLVCTLRSEEMATERIDRLCEGPVEGMQLAPLSPAELESLITRVLGGPVAPTVLDVILNLADGNPYYAEEAAEALRGRNRIRQVDGAWQLRERVRVSWNRDDLRQSSNASGDYLLSKKLRAS
jgi:DNA-binding SARP family transcriptional activator